MSNQSAEDPALTPEVDSAIRELLADQPGFPMPSVVLNRITTAIRTEATTRATLTSAHPEPTAPSGQLTKAVTPSEVHQPLRLPETVD